MIVSAAPSVRTLTIDSPLGPLAVSASAGRITAVRFGSASGTPAAVTEEAAGEVLTEAARQIGEYFAHERTAFELPLALPGEGFDSGVLAEVARIPYGTTATYGEVARAIELGPEDARAVGAAIGRNPIPVIVPCHRVIGADGSLTGYLGGLDRKQALLDLEAPQQQLA